MPPSSPLYFAYGSNLAHSQMRARCQHNPYRSAKPVAIAHLPDWTWIINERGYANVVPPNSPILALPEPIPDDLVPSGGVYGVIYDLDPKDELALDGYEGVDALRPRNATSSGWPVSVMPREQGYGSYNKWYLNARVVVSVDGTVEVGQVVKVLVYVDALRVKQGTPKLQYIGRMNNGLREADELGLPEKWVEAVVRKFIPAE